MTSSPRQRAPQPRDLAFLPGKLALFGPKIQASDAVVGRRTLEGALIDLADRIKTNDARCARAEERSALAEERSARAEEQAALALQTIAAVSQDLRAITQELRAFNTQVDARLRRLERPIPS